MIEKIVLEDLSKSKGFHFLKDLNFFKKTKEIQFTDGVNILFAPNGAGKSSLLKMLAYSLACEQGGISKVTDQWRFDIMSGYIGSGDTPREAIKNLRKKIKADMEHLKAVLNNISK